MITSYGQLPDGITRVVILDTNAYRNLVEYDSLEDAREKARQLKKLDQAAGVFAIAHPIVIWELVSHLADTTDPHYGCCQRALVALAEHTWSPQGVCVLAQEASTVCQILFGQPVNQVPGWVSDLCLLAAHVKDHAPTLIDKIALDNLKAFSDCMAKREVDWTSGMAHVLAICEPSAAKPVVGGGTPKQALKALRAKFALESFMEAWAAVTIVIPYAAELGLQLTGDQISAKAKQVKDYFPVSFQLMKDLLDKIASPDPLDVTNPNGNRWNFIWDSRIALSIGPTSNIGNADIHLVTADKEIRKAAATAGCGSRVMTLTEYLKSVSAPFA